MERKITTLIAVENKVIEIATFDNHPFYCQVIITVDGDDKAEFSLSKGELKALVNCLNVSLDYGNGDLSRP